MNFEPALSLVSYGLYVVSSHDGEKLNGQIVNTVFQVTASPAQVAVAINKKNLTHDYVSKSGVFSVSVLSEETPLKFIGLFGFRSGRDADKFASARYKPGETGSPVLLDYSLAAFEARVRQTVDAGTHTLFIGEVSGGEVFSGGKPMTYEFYRVALRGKTPAGATTYQGEMK